MGEKTSSKGAAGMVIALGIAVALLCNWGGSLEGERLKMEIVQESALANGVPQQNAFQDYEQLSDPMLVLVNEEVPLPESWGFLPFLVDDEVVDRRMAQDLLSMVQAAEKDGVWLWVASGYRSRERQQVLLDNLIQENREAGMEEEQARKDALKTVALPGHSEHETGLAVDFNDVSQQFADTEAYRWLQEHGPEFGFVQRYREGKSSVTGVEEESWHYRYVGKENAQEMERLGLCLEEYVLYRKSQGGR